MSPSVREEGDTRGVEFWHFLKGKKKCMENHETTLLIVQISSNAHFCLCVTSPPANQARANGHSVSPIAAHLMKDGQTYYFSAPLHAGTKNRK